MTGKKLITPREAEDLIANVFVTGPSCKILVQEDRAFVGGGWLNLGTVELDVSNETRAGLSAAVHHGAFLWNVVGLADARAQLSDLLDIKGMTSGKEKAEGKMARAMDSVATIGARAGLFHPRFDPHALESMPFRRSTTVVSDTSGVIQGGLDFVAKYLHPAARIKIPAIVQMEIVNFGNRFLSTRRQSSPKRRDILLDHLTSQGGQRVLLRLELQADTEIERNLLFGDPLRSAFKEDTDSELQGLNLSIPVPSYADRLILEAARQHLAHSNLGHKVQLLTSDQMLARVAIGEGISPIYFNSVLATDFFGNVFTGSLFHPFNGSLEQLSLSSVIWEFATAFGSARLESADGSASVTISAFGEGLNWAPYQSHADLLWSEVRNLPIWPTPSREAIAQDHAELLFEPAENSVVNYAPPAAAGLGANEVRNELSTPARPVKVKSSAPLRVKKADTLSMLKFSPAKLVSLVDCLDNQQELNVNDVAQLVGAKSNGGTDEYRRFLMSGNFVNVEGDKWIPTEQNTELAIALRNLDTDKIYNLFIGAPSFAKFAELFSQLEIGRTWDVDEFARAEATYRILGEITQICCPIFGKGTYSTPSSPKPDEFARIALERFQGLAHGERLVSTGAWLEALVRQDGIHPERSRVLLQEASALSLLRRSTEGSTPDLSHDRHVIQTLRQRSGTPYIEPIHLYRGDFLLPDKSSASLRVEGLIT